MIYAGRDLSRAAAGGLRSDPMTHQEKLAHFEKHLKERGFWKSNAKPPVFWLLWKLGIEVPPPYFLSFGLSDGGRGRTKLAHPGEFESTTS